MKVAAVRNTDPWFARMKRAMDGGELDAVVLSKVPVENAVHVEDVHLHHDGPEFGYRPWLRIAGVLGEMRPGVALPYGIEALTFSGSGVAVDYRYDFTEEELADMVLNKGLYAKGFEIPESITGIEWGLPGTVDLLIVSPAGLDEPPLVLCELHDQNQQQISTLSCGYDIGEYFPVKEPIGVEVDRAAGLVAGQQADTLTRDDAIHDLFAEDSLDARRRAYEEQRTLDEVTEAGFATIEEAEAAKKEPTSFATMVERANALREQRRHKVEAEISTLDPQRLEAIYADRIAGPVAKAMSDKEAEDVTAEEVGVELPLDEDTVRAAADEATALERDEKRRARALNELVQQEEAEAPVISASGNDLDFD